MILYRFVPHDGLHSPRNRPTAAHRRSPLPVPPPGGGGAGEGVTRGATAFRRAGLSSRSRRSDLAKKGTTGKSGGAFVLPLPDAMPLGHPPKGGDARSSGQMPARRSLARVGMRTAVVLDKGSPPFFGFDNGRGHREALRPLESAASPRGEA